MKVEIYTKDFCIWCDRAKGLLNAHSIDFNEIDLSENDKRAKFYENVGNNVKTVPQIFIDGQRIGGYQDLRAWLDA
ncbi:MAG: ribonucleoside-diphosphate reductase [Actinobacteria bacterium]|nr:ribonucleoside-diphosphate reductase [Actinomycetota bacterium]